MTIEDIAKEIFYHEIEADFNDVGVGQIKAWLDANLGTLNTLIDTEFETTSLFPVEEAAIFKLLYLAAYFRRKARNSIKAIASATNPAVLSIKDEDSSATFVNSNEVSKQFRQISKDMAKEAADLIYAYQIFNAKPGQVIGLVSLDQVLTD